jgi:hypothetical protein
MGYVVFLKYRSIPFPTGTYCFFLVDVALMQIGNIVTFFHHFLIVGRLAVDMSPSNQKPLPPAISDSQIEQMAQLTVAENADNLLYTHQRPQVASLHKGLVDSLFLYYEMLIKMQYVLDDDISWPPHADFATEHWLESGLFDVEVVDLMAKLPYPKGRKEIAFGAAYRTMAFSYLGYRSPDEARDPVYSGRNLVQPWELTLTSAEGGGDLYIYNVRDGIVFSLSL